MKSIRRTTQFKKDVRKVQRRGKNLDKLKRRSHCCFQETHFRPDFVTMNSPVHGKERAIFTSNQTGCSSTKWMATNLF